MGKQPNLVTSVSHFLYSSRWNTNFELKCGVYDRTTKVSPHELLWSCTCCIVELNCPLKLYLITFSPEGDLMSILHPLVYMYLPRNREWINQQSFQCTSTYYNHPAIVQTLQSSNIGSKIKMMTPYIMELTSRFFSSLITLLPLQLSHWSFSEGRLKKITWQSERIYCTRTLQTHT